MPSVTIGPTSQANGSLPTISIIATVLNEADSIDRLVDSWMVQSLRPLEIVIVDGGSVDGTWEKLQLHAREYPLLRAIRDESCNLKNSPGPIARGRNVAIAAARGDVIACSDAGCSYGLDWLERLTAPIARENAEYVLGGSCIAVEQSTVWDLASAPLMGIAMNPEGTRKSCTARSMAFTKKLWERVGGFPETTFLGEDTLFDESVQKLVTPAYAVSAMAIYAPGFSYRSSIATLARYSSADGSLGVRRPRLLRMALRCFAEVAALIALRWSAWPLLLVAGLEIYFAFERDRTVLRPKYWKALLARVLFSLSVPWVSAANYLQGWFTKANRAKALNSSH
jgi:glycosyltransferase involved in cell wall biosynthesis